MEKGRPMPFLCFLVICLNPTYYHLLPIFTVGTCSGLPRGSQIIVTINVLDFMRLRKGWLFTGLVSATPGIIKLECARFADLFANSCAP